MTVVERHLPLEARRKALLEAIHRRDDAAERFDRVGVWQQRDAHALGLEAEEPQVR
jgi:hypothetical protein